MHMSLVGFVFECFFGFITCMLCLVLRYLPRQVVCGELGL